jgi:hypothetical protein
MGIEQIRELKKQAGLAKPLKKYSIPKKSKKKEREEREERKNRAGDETALVKWFKERQKEMSGICAECGKPTNTKVYELAIHSICHLLAKRKSVAPSVACHPSNWIELCADHHYKLDNSAWEDVAMWRCWPEIKERLQIVYRDLVDEERRHFPDIAL